VAFGFKNFGAASGGILALRPDVLANDERLNTLTAAIIGAAIEVHRILGPGLLESIYLACFQFELSARGLRFESQKLVPVVYKSIRLATMHRIDLLIEDSVVVEVKSVDALLPVHQAQVLTYLRLTGCPAGLLINFNVPRLTDGVKRLLNPKREGAERTEKAGSV
jgi:GxxExxY protein